MKNVGLLISEMNGGGAERVVSHLSYILNDRYNIFVILYEDTFMEYECAGTLINMNIPAKKGLLKKLGLLFRRAKKLKTIQKQYNLDCIISFMESPNMVNLLSKSKNCSKIISVRNYTKSENSNSGFGKLVNTAMAYLYNRADKIISVSKVIAESLEQDYKLRRDKIEVIYNPYNITDIENKMKKKDYEIDVEKYIRDRIVFLSVGRFNYQKGFWHLIKAFSLFHEKCPNSSLIMVGEDYTKGRAKQLVEELHLEEFVCFTGRVKNPYKYMAISDVYVLSSLYEGFPNAMTEAMICGCAIIATDCKSGPREILFGTENNNYLKEEIVEADFGILVPTLEPEEEWDAQVITSGERTLSKAMENIYYSKELRNRMKKSAAKRGRLFTYDRCKEKYIKLIG